ncbi:MAG: TetR/AcrR family transcriptional regulator [Phycisphaerales bacterium]|nr:TetR/AcrR family transcriptional regulator [Phycisphaerales bacterium]
MSTESPFETAGVPAVLPRGPHGLDRDVVMASQRGRLLTAFVDEASEQGYHSVTIADVVARAGTAKRTFYEHFRDKEDCFVEAFKAGTTIVISAIVRAGDAADDPIERIEVGVRAYLDALIEIPNFARLLLTDVIGGGAPVARRWMRWMELLADGLIAWRNESRLNHPDLPEITKMQAVTVLSGINELLRWEIERVGVDGISAVADELIDTAIGLLTADVSHHER